MSGELCRILEPFGIDVAGVYLDDILIFAATKAKCEHDMKLTEHIAEALGVPFNDKTLRPTQNCRVWVLKSIHVTVPCVSQRNTG